MHIFPALIGKLRRDVTGDKEMLRDGDFPFTHRTVDSNSGCLEPSVKMVYCAAFDCNANSSNTKVTCSWFKFPTEPTLFKKANVKPTKHSRLCSLRENLFRLRSEQEKMVTLGYPGAKISLKEDGVLTLFLVVEAMLMPPIRRTSTTTVHLGSRRAVSADTGDVGSR